MDVFISKENIVEENSNMNENGPLVRTWLPAEPITEFQFIAAPTYVDENGVVYLHDFHKSEYFYFMFIILYYIEIFTFFDSNLLLKVFPIFIWRIGKQAKN